jgi:hypothetical protein
MSRRNAMSFGRIVDVGLMIACLAIAGLMLEQRFGRPEAQTSPREPFTPGSSVQKVAGVDFSNANRTLVIVTRSTCQYCEASGPLWRALDERRRTLGDKFRVVLVSDEPAETTHAFAKKHQLNPDYVSVTKMFIPGTPTLILVNSSSQVVKSWVGKPSTAEQAESLLEAVLSE